MTLRDAGHAPVSSMPESQQRELLARPDAAATVQRLHAVMPADDPQRDLTAELTALAVLRARDAAERRRN